MTRRDAPYVALIVVFMAITFFAGRLSVSNQPTQAPIPTTSFTAPVAMPRPAADQGADRDKVVPAGSLPPVATVERLPERSPGKAASKPADMKALTTPSAAAAVPPMKIELEDDPAAVANPYKIKPASSSPGF